MEKIMSLNFGTSFMSTKRETEACNVFVGFVLPSKGISNPGMTYRDRAMGHCLWMDGWMDDEMNGWMEKNSLKMTTTSFTICNSDQMLH
jgi:hypothetical protein